MAMTVMVTMMMSMMSMNRQPVSLRIEQRGLSYHEFANIEEQFAENGKL